MFQTTEGERGKRHSKKERMNMGEEGSQLHKFLYRDARKFLDIEAIHVDRALKAKGRFEKARFTKDKLEALEDAYKNLEAAHYALKRAVQMEEHRKGIPFDVLKKVFDSKAKMRIRIAYALMSTHRTVTVTELEKFTGINQNTISESLRRLEELGIAELTWKGNRVTGAKCSRAWREIFSDTFKDAVLGLVVENGG